MGRIYGSEDSTEPSQRRKPRLFIKEMVLENFKSYAGQQRVGPFHKCFSAVVGPNGSGKSNVIDAMLFVFGKRAKQMRLNKVSELIHNSTNHQNLEKAQVSVYFQEIIDLDDESYEPVKGSDFSITRAAFRDNTSRYYIDGRSSNFTEVTKKLMAKGIDLDNNRFLILQGEVEQISLMKPRSQGPHDEGFLEYLEDIIGSNQYVEKIEEASKQLDTVNEKRVTVVQRVKMAEKEKDSLEGAKNEAEAYMLREAELLKWRGRASELALEDSNTSLTKLRQEASDQENILRQEREKSAKYSKELKELEKEHNKHIKHREELESDLKLCAEDFKEFERQDVKYQEDLKHMKQKLKKLDDKITKDNVKVQDAEKEIEECKIKIPQLDEEINELSSQLVGEEEKLERLKELSKDEVERYRKKLVNVRKDLEPWDQKLIECQGKIDVARSECNLLKEKHAASRKAHDDSKKQIASIGEKLKNMEINLQKIDDALKENRKVTNDAENEEQVCRKEEESLIAEEQTARQRVAEMHSMLETEKSRGSVLRAILDAKQSAKIPGIFGRLGDLGAIDAKYDVAVSTACSGLDYIVVETAAAAQACVEMLRTNNLGVATFLILEKQDVHLQKMKQQVKTPEGVPRLFDLITVRDERLRVAFYSTLFNTVVAKDLEQATRIAYGPDHDFRRVVTLEGALFERSGTMSGGGAKPQGGRMGTAVRDSSVSQGEVAQAAQELDSIVKKLVAVRQRISEIVQSHQKAKKALVQLDLDLAKGRMEVEGLTAQKVDITKYLATLKESPEKFELENINQLDTIVSNEEREHERLQEASKAIRLEANELQKNIENAGGENLLKQKSAVTKLQSNIDSKSTEVNRRKVQITTGSKTIQKLGKGIEDAIKEKEKLTLDKEKKAMEFKEIEKKAFVVQEKYKSIQEIMDKQLAELESTKKVYNDLKKTVEELRAVEVDAQFKLDDVKKMVKSYDLKAKAYEKEMQENRIALQKHVEQIQKEGINPEQVKLALSVDQLNTTLKVKDAMESVSLLEAQLKELRPSLDSIAEYRMKAAQYDERVVELSAVTKEREELKQQHDELRKRRLDEFMAGFNAISLKLKEMYQMITLGGDAELELVDSLDPFAEGVVFSVRPPKKSWKNIGNLSGGEKTLSSLALVFALHHYKPTPLYVMDEIDAALDFKNVSIVGHYIKDRTKDAQFIIISLRNNMFELADRLVGIYKTDNCTKSITINPSSFATREHSVPQSEEVPVPEVTVH